jgi:transcriptional regulator with XRE-family HTH domain
MKALRVGFGRACLDTRLALDVDREELARRVGISSRYIAMIERGDANATLGVVERIAEALGLELELLARPPIFPGGSHVRDIVHARCSAYVDRRLRNGGWLTAREVEIVHGRSHGWIDLLAFDRRTGTLLVIEIKTRLDDLGALERQVGWYERMAWQPARAMGWRPRRVFSIVLALASDEVEGVVRTHRDLIGIAFPARAADLVTRPTSTATGTRGLALIDPARRRRDWLIRTSVDGRRSALPYRDYADAVRPAAASIARAPLVTNEPSEPRPMNVKPISNSGGSPSAS